MRITMLLSCVFLFYARSARAQLPASTFVIRYVESARVHSVVVTAPNSFLARESIQRAHPRARIVYVAPRHN